MNQRAKGEKRSRRAGMEIISDPCLTRSVSRNAARWARWTDCYQKTRLIWTFGFRLVGLMMLFYIAALTTFCDRLLYTYLAANAWFANTVLNWLGQDSHVSEVTIRSARFAISVRRGCDAIEPAWLFCAAAISFPAPIGRKLFGMATGTALLLILNLARIVTLYFVGMRFPRVFSTVHLEIWPAVFVTVAILLWIGWIKGTRPTGPRLRYVPT